MGTIIYIERAHTEGTTMCVASTDQRFTWTCLTSILSGTPECGQGTLTIDSKFNYWLQISAFTDIRKLEDKFRWVDPATSQWPLTQVTLLCSASCHTLHPHSLHSPTMHHRCPFMSTYLRL